MAVIDAVARVFPGLAEKYVRARAKYELARLYAAATPSHLRPARGGKHSGDAVMDSTGDALRQLARYLDENHDLVVGVFDDLLANTIGDGRVPIPLVRLRGSGQLSEEDNDRLLDQWMTWSERADTTQQYGWTELERLTMRTYLRDGEVFTRMHRSSRYPFRTETRLALEMLEADYCQFSDTNRKENRMHGVEMGSWGIPRAYYFLMEHPGSHHMPLTRTFGRTVRVPADRVIHLRFVRRFHQVRGVPILHASMQRLRDIHDYEDSERIAARVAADMTAFVKRTGDFQGTIDTDISKRLLQMGAGSIWELLPGEDVGTINSNRPNSGLADFRNAMMRAVAAGTGTRYSAIARDYNGTYSAQRQELVEATVHYRALFKVMVNAWYKPLWREFLEQTPVRLSAAADPATFDRVEFRPPALPWIDPVKEAQAWQLLVDAELESRTEIIRSRGRDPKQVREEIEQEPTPMLIEQAMQTNDDSSNEEDVA